MYSKIYKSRKIKTTNNLKPRDFINFIILLGGFYYLRHLIR